MVSKYRAITFLLFNGLIQINVAYQIKSGRVNCPDISLNLNYFSVVISYSVFFLNVCMHNEW